MRIILLGAPGSGKGTQAKFIIDKYRIPYISIGDILRQETIKNNFLSKKIKYIIDSGKLIPDNLIMIILKRELKKNNYYNKFLLDGIPRTIFQAKLIKYLHITHVLKFIIPKKLILKRLSGRLIHIKSGRVYHKIFNPPKNFQIDDITGEKLVIRNDDNTKIIKKRLYEYYSTEKIITHFYKKEAYLKNLKFLNIDATLSINIIHKIIQDFLKN